MNEFFHSTLFLVLLAQSTAYLSDEFMGSLMEKRGHGATPFFYYSSFYRIVRFISIAITIITFIICCYRYSWWLIIVLPLVDLIASSSLAAIINLTILKIFGGAFTRFLAVIATIILDIVLICMLL